MTLSLSVVRVMNSSVYVRQSGAEMWDAIWDDSLLLLLRRSLTSAAASSDWPTELGGNDFCCSHSLIQTLTFSFPLILVVTTACLYFHSLSIPALFKIPYTAIRFKVKNTNGTVVHFTVSCGWERGGKQTSLEFSLECSQTLWRRHVWCVLVDRYGCIQIAFEALITFRSVIPSNAMCCDDFCQLVSEAYFDNIFFWLRWISALILLWFQFEYTAVHYGIGTGHITTGAASSSRSCSQPGVQLASLSTLSHWTTSGTTTLSQSHETTKHHCCFTARGSDGSIVFSIVSELFLSLQRDNSRTAALSLLTFCTNVNPDDL